MLYTVSVVVVLVKTLIDSLDPLSVLNGINLKSGLR